MKDWMRAWNLRFESCPVRSIRLMSHRQRMSLQTGTSHYSDRSRGKQTALKPPEGIRVPGARVGGMTLKVGAAVR
jgi:hypothetical protein